MNKGFSVVELLVIAAIIATFSVVLILNFRISPKTRTARNQVAAVMASDIRRAQSMAVSGAGFQGSIVCGYGIHYVSNVSYLIYAGFLGGASNCQASNHNYQAGTDIDVETKFLINANMEIRSSFSDVFFESPDPKTYINNSPPPGGPSVTISIQLKNQQNCAQQSCTQVTISPSGQINIAN